MAYTAIDALYELHYRFLNGKVDGRDAEQVRDRPEPSFVYLVPTGGKASTATAILELADENGRTTEFTIRIERDEVF